MLANKHAALSLKLRTPDHLVILYMRDYSNLNITVASLWPECSHQLQSLQGWKVWQKNKGTYRSSVEVLLSETPSSEIKKLHVSVFSYAHIYSSFLMWQKHLPSCFQTHHGKSAAPAGNVWPHKLVKAVTSWDHEALPFR